MYILLDDSFYRKEFPVHLSTLSFEHMFSFVSIADYFEPVNTQKNFTACCIKEVQILF